MKSESLLRSLMQRAPARESWEVGGNCNFMIAAARLGMHVAAVGNLGVDVYGRFLRDILQVRPAVSSSLSRARKSFCVARRAACVRSAYVASQSFCGPQQE